MQFLRAHPEMANEGTPPALPQVIESLPKKNITKEQVGKCHHKGVLQKVSDISALNLSSSLGLETSPVR